MKNKVPLTVVILTSNSEAKIERAIKSADFADEVLLIDQGSADKTVALATGLGARVVSKSETSFALKRNLGLQEANNDWVFYLDHDEEITPALAQEIMSLIKMNEPGAFLVTRQNYFLGRQMYTDQVERLFHKKLLRGWEGEVHEHPNIVGETNKLIFPLLHYTHTDITSMLAKTNEWSEIEAYLRIKAHHPPVKWWRLVRIAMTVWWDQLVHKKIWKYGREGWFEGYFQMVDKLIVYTKLWERQQ